MLAIFKKWWLIKLFFSLSDINIKINGGIAFITPKPTLGLKFMEITYHEVKEVVSKYSWEWTETYETDTDGTFKSFSIQV